jgi:hypothetical protein
MYSNLIVVKLIDIFSAWIGLKSANNRQRTDAFLGRCHTVGLCEMDNLLLTNLSSIANEKLLDRILKNNENISSNISPDLSVAYQNYSPEQVGIPTAATPNAVIPVAPIPIATLGQ